MSLLDLKGKLDQIWILAKGPTWFHMPERTPPNTEVWGINTTYRDRPDQLDRLFILHDIRETMWHEDYNLVEEINKVGVPVYTAGIYKVLDNCHDFPAKEIVQGHGIAYMMNVIAWMVALAAIIKPKELHLYGADYAFGVDINEKCCTEFWLGVAKGAGIKLVIPERSTLLKPPELRMPLYGYIKQRHEPCGIVHITPKRIKDKCATKYVLTPIGEER